MVSVTHVSAFDYYACSTKKCLTYLEPTNVEIDGVNTTSFRVSFQAPSGNRDIDRFEVSIEGGCITKICTLTKSASPLQCQFGELLPATRYAVNVRSCLPLSIGCSGNVTVLAVTTPKGTLSAVP